MPPDALRDEITFFGHIIQGNRITIKTDDMKVLNPDEDEIFEICVRRIVPPKSLKDSELNQFGKAVVEVLRSEGVVDDPDYLLLLFLRKHGVGGASFKKENLTDALVLDLYKAALAVHQDKKLADILKMKLERMKE